jgi:hypothetical protein
MSIPGALTRCSVCLTLIEKVPDSYTGGVWWLGGRWVHLNSECDQTPAPLIDVEDVYGVIPLACDIRWQYLAIEQKSMHVGFSHEVLPLQRRRLVDDEAQSCVR